MDGNMPSLASRPDSPFDFFDERTLQPTEGANMLENLSSSGIDNTSNVVDIDSFIDFDFEALFQQDQCDDFLPGNQVFAPSNINNFADATWTPDSALLQQEASLPRGLAGYTRTPATLTGSVAIDPVIIENAQQQVLHNQQDLDFHVNRVSGNQPQDLTSATQLTRQQQTFSQPSDRANASTQGYHMASLGALRRETSTVAPDAQSTQYHQWQDWRMPYHLTNIAQDRFQNNPGTTNELDQQSLAINAPEPSGNSAGVPFNQAYQHHPNQWMTRDLSSGNSTQHTSLSRQQAHASALVSANQQSQRLFSVTDQQMLDAQDYQGMSRLTLDNPQTYGGVAQAPSYDHLAFSSHINFSRAPGSTGLQIRGSSARPLQTSAPPTLLPSAPGRSASKGKGKGKVKDRHAAFGGENPICLDCGKKFRTTGSPGRCQRCGDKYERAIATPRTYVLDPDVPDLQVARSLIYPVTPQRVIANDDVEHLWANEDHYMNRLLEAVNVVQEDVDGRAWRARQQKTFNEKAKLESGYSDRHVTARLFALYWEVVFFHRGGPSSIYATGGDNSGYSENRTMKFSERIDRICWILETNKRVVMDVVEGRGVKGFVGNPLKYHERKASNNFCNVKKKGIMEMAKSMGSNASLAPGEGEAVAESVEEAVVSRSRTRKRRRVEAEVHGKGKGRQVAEDVDDMSFDEHDGVDWMDDE